MFVNVGKIIVLFVVLFAYRLLNQQPSSFLFLLLLLALRFWRTRAWGWWSRTTRWRWRRWWTWWRRTILSWKIPSPSVSASSVMTMTPLAISASVLFLTRRLDNKSASFHFFVIHLLDSSLSIKVIFKFLDSKKVTMKEYGPLYWMQTILPNYLNQPLRSSFVIFFPYPLT